MKRNVSCTKDMVSDIKRSMSVFTEPDGFTQIKSRSKTDTRAVAHDSSTIIVSSETTTDIDPEITFASVIKKDKPSGKTDCTSSGEKEKVSADDNRVKINEEISSRITALRNSTTVSAERNQGDSNRQNIPKEQERNEERSDSYRKPLVCLIGDSIPGQVAASYLGKSTNSFVKKLRAPKIQDIGKYANDVKGAKVIVIHAGINNLRDKETTSDIVSNLKEAVASLGEAAPGTKVLLSKAAPVGERGLEIERNILNAEAERALSGMMDGRISYIDHSNLADRGFIIKDYYRPDELHLSKDGIYQYTGNLKEAIHKALHEKQGTSYDTKR